MKALSKHLHTLFSEAEKNSARAAEDFDEDAIHEMRVAFKKIRSAFNMMIYLFPQRLSEEDWKKAKKTFRRAGVLRENQLIYGKIERMKLKDEESKKMLLDFLKEKEKKSKNKFEHQFEHAGIEEHKELKKKMIEISKDITEAQLAIYFENLLGKILELRKKSDRTIPELHSLRKLLKELKYNLALAPLALKEKISIEFPEKNIEDWEVLIGDWHDEIVFILRIKKIEERMTAEGNLKLLLEKIQS
ncbi:MAG: CHAD domain-containing protein, partial [Chitinophagales bacterium]